VATENEHGRFDKINDIYVLIHSGAHGEGIVSIKSGDLMCAIVEADESKLPQIKTLAQGLADKRGMTLKIIRLSVREEVCEIKRGDPLPKLDDELVLELPPNPNSMYNPE
jgi:hypothetical protein